MSLLWDFFLFGAVHLADLWWRSLFEYAINRELQNWSRRSAVNKRRLPLYSIKKFSRITRNFGFYFTLTTDTDKITSCTIICRNPQYVRSCLMTRVLHDTVMNQRIEGNWRTTLRRWRNENRCQYIHHISRPSHHRPELSRFRDERTSGEAGYRQ